MTSPNPLPTAAEALSLAFQLVATPCSAAETARAMALFEIARELRVASDMRMLNARREAADRLRLDLDISRARGKLDAAGIPTQVFPQVPAPDFAVTQLREQAPAQEWPDPVTQVLQVPPAHGDKADCRYCHTPIVFEARRMQDPVTLDDGDPQYLWVHKYTDQRVCATPVMAKEAGCDMGDEDCSCERPTHTFAEPEPRR